MSIIYLNGQFIPLEEAKISVLDRGFTFGDGVYEVIPVYQRHIFCLDEHIARLENSLAAIYMENPLSRDQWRTILAQLVANDPAEDQSLYIQITRGISGRDHAINADAIPTVFAMNRPLIKKDFSDGISAITSEDIRWQLCYIKAITLLPNVLLRQQAAEQGAVEAILTRDNKVTEGAASSVFVVKDNIVSTPLKDKTILPGITRDLVISILKEADFICNETYVLRDDLLNADEIWITSSTWEIAPVTKLDNRLIGDGYPGEVWKKAIALYQAFKNRMIEN